MISNRIGVVIPCFRVKNQILDVLSKIGNVVDKIYVIDDCCPEDTASYVQKNTKDARITVVRNRINLGVGGAVIEGYKLAIKDKLDVVIKLDGDGQMDPSLIEKFTIPITSGEADYVKGNRFQGNKIFSLMPKIRLIGNAFLSILTKLSSGYWDIYDPTNGYTAIHMDVLKNLPLEKISKRFFFESDMLFWLNISQAVVKDIPMDARYGLEKSNLKVTNIILEFFFKNVRNFVKRIAFNYFLRDLSLASFQLLLGMISFLFGVVYGLNKWSIASDSNMQTPLGQIMIAVLTILIGFHLIISFFNHDVASIPKVPLQIKNLKD